MTKDGKPETQEEMIQHFLEWTMTSEDPQAKEIKEDVMEAYLMREQFRASGY